MHLTRDKCIGSVYSFSTYFPRCYLTMHDPTGIQTKNSSIVFFNLFMLDGLLMNVERIRLTIET